MDAQGMFDTFVRSEKIAKHAGMIAFNINVVNAVAAIFAATGQDIACVGESGTGFLSLTPQKGSILFEVLMTNLIVGTVGGGTALPAQNGVLRLMDCVGSGKVDRFASIIAGYALALELSAFAAVVGGQFARAHQVFGRNKPKNWLVRSEFDTRFVKPILQPRIARQCLPPPW
jgi:hydroxymethylglutaryl-CoA reductase (NADPH)